MSKGVPVRLTEEHAELLAQLETSYPEGMRQGEEAIRQKLKELDDSGESLSWMLAAGDECLGYIVAWPGESLLDLAVSHRVIFIDDLQVRPGHTGQLYLLLKLLADDIQQKGLTDLSVEGVCRRNAYKVFKEHEGPIARLGYELLATYEYWEASVGEELCWMRWAPLHLVGETVEATLPDDAWIPSAAEAAPVMTLSYEDETVVETLRSDDMTDAAEAEAEFSEQDIWTAVHEMKGPEETDGAEDSWTPATQAQMLQVRAKKGE